MAAVPMLPLPGITGAKGSGDTPSPIGKPDDAPGPIAGSSPSTASPVTHQATAGLGETRATFVDWIATNNPRTGGLCPGEVGLGVLFAFTIVVFLLAQWRQPTSVFEFLYYFSVPIAALATAGAALETWRNLRQIERTDEGAMTPHLWLLGVQQNRLAAPGRGSPNSVTGLHELFLHNYGPGLAVDIRILIDGKLIDRIPFIDPGATAQVGGAFHGHGLEGSHALKVTYEASSGREHRLDGTLFRDRDMEEILFRSDQFNHVYSVA